MDAQQALQQEFGDNINSVSFQNSQPVQPTQPTQPPQQQNSSNGNIFTDFAKSILNPFARVGVWGYNQVAAPVSAINDVVRGRGGQQAMQDFQNESNAQRNLPFFGQTQGSPFKVTSSPQSASDIASQVGNFAGLYGNIASDFIGGEGTGEVVGDIGKKGILQLGKEGAMTGLKAGALQGLSSALQDKNTYQNGIENGIGDIATTTIEGGGTGLVAGGVLGAAGGAITNAKNTVSDFPSLLAKSRGVPEQAITDLFNRPGAQEEFAKLTSSDNANKQIVSDFRNVLDKFGKDAQSAYDQNATNLDNIYKDKNIKVDSSTESMLNELADKYQSVRDALPYNTSNGVSVDKNGIINQTTQLSKNITASQQMKIVRSLNGVLRDITDSYGKARNPDDANMVRFIRQFKSEVIDNLGGKNGEAAQLLENYQKYKGIADSLGKIVLNNKNKFDPVAIDKAATNLMNIYKDNPQTVLQTLDYLGQQYGIDLRGEIASMHFLGHPITSKGSMKELTKLILSKIFANKVKVATGLGALGIGTEIAKHLQ